MPERIFSEGVLLPDDRKVRVLAYDDGSVRFRLDGAPYVMEEAFLAGGRNDHAIVKLAPRNATAVALEMEAESDDPVLTLRAQVAGLKAQLDQAPEMEGKGRYIRHHQREAIDAALIIVLKLIDDVLERDEA